MEPERIVSVVRELVESKDSEPVAKLLTLRSLPRLRLAMVRRILRWIPRRLEFVPYGSAPLLGTLLFALTFCQPIAREVADYVEAGEVEKALRRARDCIETVEAGDGSLFLKAGVISTPIANQMATSLVEKYYAKNRGAFYPGRQVFVYGERGCGKTTMVFWSVYSVLQYLGMGPEEAKDVVKSLWVNTVDGYMRMLETASKMADRGEILPFIVFDDASIGLSKYMMMAAASTKVEKAIARRIIELEQIAREGVGVTVTIAHPGLLLKGLRTLPGIHIYGRFEDVLQYRYTLWMAKTSHDERAPVMDFFSTIHPALKTPDDVLKSWLSEKLARRAALIEEISKLQTLRESEAEAGEEEEEDLLELEDYSSPPDTT